MALTLILTDNTDGSGGQAVIAGSAGATNVIYYAAFDGNMQSFGMTSGGSLVGDGTIPLSIPVGFYWFVLLSNGAMGPSAYQAFTTPTTAYHKAIMDGVQVRIASTGVLASSSILEKWISRAEDVDLTNLPLILITPIGNERYSGQTNKFDDIGYPVQVTYVGKQNQDSVANLNTVLMFRQLVSMALIKQRIPSVGGTWNCDIDNDLVYDPGMFFKNYLTSTIPMIITLRRTRGIS